MYQEIYSESDFFSSFIDISWLNGSHIGSALNS